MLVGLVLPRGTGRTAEGESSPAEGAGYWRRFGEGLGFLRGDPLLLTVIVMGAAAVGGSLIAAVVAHRLRRRMVVLAGFLLVGAPRFLILATDAPLGAVLAVFAVGGFGAGFVNPVLGAVFAERVPRRMLGRVTPSATHSPGQASPSAGCSQGRR